MPPSSSSARISISSDEVNLLVYRYLIEAGFKHTAFVFHGESLLHRSPNVVQSDMPPGTLVTLLQKALLFLFVETHVANDGQTIECDEPFSVFRPHEHDHGPVDAPVDFELAASIPVVIKKQVTSIDEKEEMRPVKKQKPSAMKEIPSVSPSAASTPMEVNVDPIEETGSLLAAEEANGNDDSSNGKVLNVASNGHAEPSSSTVDQ